MMDAPLGSFRKSFTAKRIHPQQNSPKGGDSRLLHFLFEEQKKE